MSVNISSIESITRDISQTNAVPFELFKSIANENLSSYSPLSVNTALSTNDTPSHLRNYSNGTYHHSDVTWEPDSWSDVTSYVIGSLCLGIASFGVLFNTVVIFSIIHNHQLRSHISNVLICNLAVGSLIGCVIVLTVEVPIRLQSKRSVDEFRDTTCNMIGFVSSVLNIGTIWSVVALSIDKYRSIDSPLRHSIVANTFKCVVYLFLIWITASVLSSLPFLLGQKYAFQPAQGTCDFRYMANSMYWYILAYLGLVFYIPAAIVCFCHWRIFAIARGQSRRMAAMVHLVTLIHVPLLNGRMANQQLSPQGRKAIYTTSIFVGTFLVCYIPHTLTATGRIFFEPLNNQILVSISNVLMKSAFMVNIFIYGCRNRMVRDSLAKYVRKKLLERASSVQWKRRHRSSTRSSQRIVRVDRCSNNRFNHRPVLQAVRSQPNLHTVQITPVLPRAISLEVDLARAIEDHVIDGACSTSSDDLPPASENQKVFVTTVESLEVIEEGEVLGLKDFETQEANEIVDDPAETMDAGEEPDVDTPMLSAKTRINSGGNGQISRTNSVPNGIFTYPAVSKTTFVELRESVV